MINFYIKYIPGNVYINAIVASVSESIAHFCTSYIIKLLGARNSITSMYAISGIATIFLWVSEAKGFIKEVPFFILLAKFGVSSIFTLMYISMLIYFPSRFMGAVFGIANTACRAVTIFAPVVAEIDTPVPEVSLILICVIAVVLSQLLVIPDDMKGV